MASKTKTAPSRAKKAEPKRKKHTGLRAALILIFLLIALVFAVYLYLCMQVDQDTIIGDVTIQGVDVQGMTREEAASAVDEALANVYQGQTVDILLAGETYSVTVWSGEQNLLTWDYSDALDEAMEPGHGDFLTRGWEWLQVEMGNAEAQTVTVSPTLTDTESLKALIQATGIEAVDTAVETTYTIEDDCVVITKGSAGVTADVDTLTDQVASLVNSGSWPEEHTVDCATLSSEIAELDIQAIYDQIYVEPVSATLDPDNDYAIVPSTDGVSFDIDAATQALADAEAGSQVTVELVYTEPDVTTAFLEEHLFADVLGSYTTTVSGSSGRVSNVKLSAQFCDGTILLPGEIFNYNDTVGQRTTARGFSAAPAYNNGETVQEVGGGICQTSSTLYAACLYANLEIVTRTNHTYASSYIGLGLDATVSWGGPEFEFANSTDYPIKIVTSYSGGKLTVSIYGTKTDDITVKIVSKTLETIPYSTTYTTDSSLSSGQSKVITTPYTGYKVQTYRELYDGNGNLISSTEEAYSYYKARNKVIATGD
ncbi:MAG: VanW family protein [Clostridiales bacterium]|nr:VanW family protein [Clostridiales bacterium]